MTSGRLEPVLDNAGGPHSAFTEVSIRVLQENDGVLRGRDMFRQLQLRVATMAERFPVPQISKYGPIQRTGHKNGDFVLVRPSS